MRQQLRQTVEVLRLAGWRSVLHRFRHVIRRRLRAPDKREVLPVDAADLLAERPRATNPDPPPVEIRNGTRRVAWVVPAIWPGSGGHHDIYRMVQHLETAGYSCVIHLYEPIGGQSVAEFARIAARHFSSIAAPVVGFDAAAAAASDAVIATSWNTAYPVAGLSGRARRFYFVQDFEPYFYPLGSEYVLAEESYRLGLHGITLGPWLAGKLTQEYGMPCEAIDFQADLRTYRSEGGDRHGVVFYARPSSPRRAFALGLLGLQGFHEEHPDVPIHLFGADLRRWSIPFTHVSHGVLDDTDLNALYNSANVGLVLSMTNLSLVPMELLAAGCLPVVNAGAHNEQNLVNPYVAFAPPTPRGLAAALSETFDRARAGGPTLVRAASDSVSTASWEAAGQQFERALRRELP